MPDRDTDRLDDLETRNALLEKEVSDLNEVVTTLSGEIETLKKYIKIKLDKIQNTMNDSGENDFKSISDEAAANKPPHY